MNQLDFFDITLEGKIYRMEKWIGRLNRELMFLKKVYEMNDEIKRRRTVDSNSMQYNDGNSSHQTKLIQLDIFK